MDVLHTTRIAPVQQTVATSEMWCKFSSWSVSRFYAA